MNTEERAKVVQGSYPCASDDQYKEWKTTARMMRPPTNTWFCTDCTPQYQREMKAQQLCSRPEIRFRSGADGIEGYLP
jgi:hypothetical protein